MERKEMAALLAFISATDGRRITDHMPAAWMEILGDYRYEDCKGAVRQHFEESTEWLMPAHIVRRVKAMGKRRLADVGAVELTAADSESVEGELRARRRLVRALVRGDVSAKEYRAYVDSGMRFDEFVGPKRLT